jgi:flagellin
MCIRDSDDTDAIQKEIDSLRKEIDRISTDTEFNTKALFNGNLDRRVYADHISRVSVTDAVIAGEYLFTIDQAATQAVYNDPNGVITQPDYIDDNGNIPSTLPEIPEDAEGIVVINGREIKIEAGDTPEIVYGKLREGAEFGECSIVPLDAANNEKADYAFGDALKITSDFYGKDSTVQIACSNEKLASFLGLPTNNADAMPAGTDAKITLDKDSAFGMHCTCAMDGNKVTITNRAGFEISFMVEEGYASADPIVMEVTNIGTLTLQIGANEDQTMEVRIPEISTKSLYIDDMNVTTVNGADRAIVQLDNALEIVSNARSKIGAYQNRLDHAIASLDQSGEDMTAALSRIEDVDMAEEMTEYTKGNVLSQAATSVLAQANEIPQQVLQLLQ